MSLRGSFSYKEAAGVLVAMSLCLPAAFAAEKSFDLTLSVNGPVTLRVSTGSGYIRVSQGSDNQVHIVGHVKGNSWWGGGSAEDAVSRVADHTPIAFHAGCGDGVGIGEVGSSVDHDAWVY